MFKIIILSIKLVSNGFVSNIKQLPKETFFSIKMKKNFILNKNYYELIKLYDIVCTCRIYKTFKLLFLNFIVESFSNFIINWILLIFLFHTLFLLIRLNWLTCLTIIHQLGRGLHNVVGLKDLVCLPDFTLNIQVYFFILLYEGWGSGRDNQSKEY